MMQNWILIKLSLCFAYIYIYIFTHIHTLVCNPCLHMGMKNWSGAIDVSFRGIKMVFPFNFYGISYAKFLITLLLYIILKITVEYYIYYINSQSLYLKFY